MNRIFLFLALIAAGLCALSSCGDPGPGAANVLLITLDTVRADRLGCYGYRPAGTPNMDAVADRGVMFTNAFTPVPITLPSHATILTGLHPVSHGVRNNGTFALAEPARTLAEDLGEKGYATGAVLSAVVLDRIYGLAQGFDYYDDDIADQGDLVVAQRRGDLITESGLEWLDDNGDGPFFLWLHYYDAHVPYDPPSPFREKFRNDPYDGEIAFIDHHLKPVFAKLDELGVADDTLIVIVGDHGEGLGEHLESTHGIFIYDSTMRVPLIVSGPGVPDGGKKIDTLVDLLDIRPTILDLAGVEAGSQSQGRSLAPLIRGEEMEDRPVLLDSEYSLENYGWSPVAGVRTREWKFIDAPRPELYNLADDARELDDLSRSEPEIFEKMEKMYLQLRKESEADAGEMSRARAMTDAMESKLAELGYASSRDERAGQAGKDPKDMVKLDAAYNNAMTLARQGRKEESIELFKDIIARDPENVRALVALGSALIRKAVEEDPQRIREIVQSGGKPAESPLLDQAEYYLRRAAEAGPQVYSVHMNLAMLFKNRGNFEDARKELEAAMVLKPFSPEPANDLGVVSLMLGEPREAEKWFRKALEIDPSDASTRINLGMLFMRTKRLKEAETEFAAVLKDEPENVIALVQLGVVNDMAGRTPVAIELGEKARDIAPDDHVIHDCLEQWYAKVGREADSREAGRRRLELQRRMLREQQMRK